ncbi:efflux transporter outer membrane subunit [Geobacter sp. AOG1]|uniref:efflux transporter outer membrane subunit n=1 Tax=Geobacter sp. AOG1 TaxID=1566346 RepID=UPI001CC4D487|nr:efflux transporter outer membrane subunit [Geobacter sp. AOG1]GFE58826.1 RND transporter [Geobacter sp. AOG1]
MKISGITARILLVFCPLLGACTVGPDYVRPTPVETMPTVYKELEGWKVAQPRDGNIPERWWELYDDPALNSLEEQVAISNLTVAAAEAQFRQARALVQAARAGYFPSVSAGASATRSRSSANLGNGRSGGATVSDFQLPLDLTWELDLWGRIRRGVEASQANAQASAADLAAVTLSTQAELASDYFQLRILDAQKGLLDATLATYRKSLELTNNRYVAGVVARSDVLQAETQLKTTEAQLIDLDVQRAQLEHAIALLIGKPPAAFSLPAAPLTTVFPQIPTGLPAELLERRPDIASSERKMAAANAQIGIAKAAYFPTIRLSGAAGFEASSLASWFSWPSRFWSVGPAVAETLFDGGLRKAQSDQVRAAYDATVAAYRETVLTGFQEVEDNLAALRILEEESRVQDQAVQAAEQVVSITTNQYQAGTVAYLNVLVAQSTALANERTALGLLGRRLTASVLLVKVLGGGWIPK